MNVFVVTAYTGTKRITIKEKKIAETQEEADQLFAQLVAKYEGTKVKVNMYEAEADGPIKEEKPVKEPLKRGVEKKKTAKKKAADKKKSAVKKPTRSKK